MPALVEVRAQRVAGVRPHDEQVVDVVRAVERRVDQLHRAVAQAVAERRAEFTATAVPALEPAQLDAEDRGLERVQARGGPDHAVPVARALAVRAQQAHPIGEVLVTGDDGAAVAPRAEVLGRVEGEAAGVAERADGTALVASPCAPGTRPRSPRRRRRRRPPGAGRGRPWIRRGGPGSRSGSRGVMCSATISAVSRCVRSSTSTRHGVAPARLTASAVAMNELAGTMTSSPGPTPSACRARTIASVPEETPTACGASNAEASSASKRSSASPIVKAPVAAIRATTSSSSATSAGSSLSSRRSGIRSSCRVGHAHAARRGRDVWGPDSISASCSCSARRPRWCRPWTELSLRPMLSAISGGVRPTT